MKRSGFTVAVGTFFLVLALISVLAFVFVFPQKDAEKAANTYIPWSCPCSVQVDGKVYCCYFVELEDEKTADQEISGTIKTVVTLSGMPTRDDEANFPAAEGACYIKRGEDVAILINDIWYICEYVREAEA